ncbi:MAG: NAD(P)-binding protein [Verrucomicrobia bacterium]|nr:NAD(P)-binding protein [Verrucomicrobiota bacterium]
MSAPRPITIVGGGLAGLTLGIALRQRDVPVTVVEASHYPRHRVCGEFISGAGKRVLGELGLLGRMETAGLRFAESAAFFSQRFASPVRKLPDSALCISRFELDALLAKEFQQLGGQLKENCRWREPFSEGMVRATGRRLKPLESGWRWFGLKIHARDVRLQADLEMHFTERGYVGICQLPENTVNICGLFRSRQTQPELAREWKEWLCGSPGSALRERLANAAFEESSFCSVAGLSLRANRAGDQAECSIGDAISMIAPVTGNGMSMAFESALIASESLANFSRQTMDWDETRQKIAADCDKTFKTRLAWSGWLQPVIMQPAFSNCLIGMASRSETIWNLLFQKTR